jgi:transcriptional regulator with XRE-family HTH domain
MEELNLNKSKFSKRLGINSTRISQYTTGDNPTKPSVDFLILIKQKIPEINMNWVLGDRTEPMMIGEESATNGFTDRTISILKKQIKSLQELAEAKDEENEELLRRIEDLQRQNK